MTRNVVKTPPRHLVLGAALFLAIAASVLPRTAAVHAQEAPRAAAPALPGLPPAPPKPGVTIEKQGKTTTITTQGKDGTKTITIEKSGNIDAADADSSDNAVGLNIGPGKHGRKIQITAGGSSDEYDSFSDFVHTEPGLAAMVVGIVGIVFLSPVLAIGLILGYRMRKARLMNETMIKLAEKGVVPPAEAMAAIAAGMPASALHAGPATAPIYEQAKQVRKRAAWSDLRKGVMMTAIGIGWTGWAVAEQGSPHWLGFVLLFVGLGYIVLWWFEERQLGPAAPAPAAAPTTGLDGPADGKSGGA